MLRTKPLEESACIPLAAAKAADKQDLRCDGPKRGGVGGDTVRVGRCGELASNLTREAEISACVKLAFLGS